MRIAILNPDTIGDVIIRQPMFAALRNRGHRVLIAIRDLVAPISGLIAPGADVLIYPANPYTSRIDWESVEGREFLRKLRAFDPEVLAIAPFQHTEFEESVAGLFPHVRIVGFDGYLHSNGYPPVKASSFRNRLNAPVATAPDSAETRKSELLCSAILGEKVDLAAPRLDVSEDTRIAARRRLKAVGLSGEKYWCVCAGDSPGVEVRNWETGRWAELLRDLPSKFGVKLLFIGSRDEHETTARILAAMGEASQSAVDLTKEPAGLDLALGLLAESQGYIGKDTGPMHMAAAIGRPVFAIFGGGTWPRFIPAAQSGRAITVGVPCSGCVWHCHLDRSVCVKDVPVVAAREQLYAVMEGNAARFDAVVLEPDPLASARLVNATWSRFWEQKRAIDKERSDFMQWHKDRVSDIDKLKAEVAAKAALVDPGLLETERARVRQLEEEVRATHRAREQAGSFDEMAGMVSNLEERARLLDLRAEELLAERRTILSGHRELAESKTAVELRFAAFRRKAAEKILEARRAERSARLAADCERAAAESRVLAAMDNLAAERKIDAGKLRAAAAEAEFLRVRLAEADSERLSAVAEIESVLRETQRELDSALQLIPDLRNENLSQKTELVAVESTLNEIRSELNRAQSELERTRADFDAKAAQAAELESVRLDQSAKQALIERLDSQIKIIEQDRAERGAQIETLHRMIDKLRADHVLQLAAAEQRVENVRAEFALYKSRLPIRMLRGLGLA